jgi:hypothetical protein
LCFTCPEGQQRLYLLNKITRNHLQLTASFLTTLHLNQRQGSDSRSFSEQSPRFSNIWISCTIILLKKFQASIRYKRLYFFTKKYKDLFQL